jgi:hypothetical protein
MRVFEALKRLDDLKEEHYADIIGRIAARNTRERKANAKKAKTAEAR